MTTTARPNLAVCPACVAAPTGEQVMQDGNVPMDAQIALSLPTIHCSACIAKIERGLNAHPLVQSARVNLTLKRAHIVADTAAETDDMVTLVQGLGYEAHELDLAVLSATEADKAGRDLLMRLAVAGFASMNVMLLSVAVWSGATDATRDLFHWISAGIALPAIAFSGQPFFRNAWAALSKRSLNMDVPISLAILLAIATSLWETALSGEHAYFDAALTLTFFLLAGRYLDHRTRAVARSAAEELTALEVPRALKLIDGKEQEVAVVDLTVGDLIRVRPGGRMPVDGVIVAGVSEIDRSLLTGETLPVFANEGQAVSTGEMNLTGPLTIKALAIGQDTSLHQMADLVAIAESGRSRYTSLADKAAKLYAPGVHILSALTFLGWYMFTWDLRTALNIAAAVLIITCPCALGLAVPAVTTAASGRLFRKGLLIKHETALERLAAVDTVVFDKTGTLTAGVPEVINASEIPHKSMTLAMGLAQGSSHPLAQAIARAGEVLGVEAATLTNMIETPGYGTTGQWNGKQVMLGRATWVGAHDCERTATFLKVGDAKPVAFTFSDRLREGAVEAVEALKASGKEVHLLSGDSAGPVSELAQRLGIEQFEAGVLPAEKVSYINDLSGNGAHVLMVGDGLNDTAALAAAHVSISPASALDAARVASDIVLLGNDLAPISGACETAKSATKRIRENFRIATLYNVIAVPLAVAGLATPLIAALAMSTSSITVSLNALRLR
ncbi:heavy metal translocating P-type ATPase [Roseovarius sp. EL26]|uniref:heavy metal translocating P-type ATPase n=1 Tax=Roseovarius sp. EL26 TaxID=2126672 RepID=UPI000EA0A759|nr:heavy metal translocating P-type ATPase [Roseovarius sp. EL26]